MINELSRCFSTQATCTILLTAIERTKMQSISSGWYHPMATTDRQCLKLCPLHARRPSNASLKTPTCTTNPELSLNPSGNSISGTLHTLNPFAMNSRSHASKISGSRSCCATTATQGVCAAPSSDKGTAVVLSRHASAVVCTSGGIRASL